MRSAFEHHDYHHSALYGATSNLKRDDDFLSLEIFFHVQLEVTDDETMVFFFVFMRRFK